MQPRRGAAARHLAPLALTKDAPSRQDDRPAPPSPYLHNSVEAQMRQLADLALLLGFREFAVATYRLAAQASMSAEGIAMGGRVRVRVRVRVCVCVCCF